MPRRSAFIGGLVALLVVAGSSTAWATSLGHFKQFPTPTPNSEPRMIAAGPDGALWFTEFNTSQIGRITTAGAITEFPVAGSTFPFDIAAGPDGRMWFTESESLIGAINPATGRIRQFVLPRPDTDAAGITGGPDGAVWFTETPGDAIARITPAGQVTEFMLPPGSSPSGITTGPDGALWFTEPGNGIIGRITTTGQLTTFTGADLNGSITSGPDGNLWFTTGFDQNIGRITTDGQVTLFPLPQPGTPDAIVTGADGNLWFTEFAASRMVRSPPEG
jgi:virginiamycin B lyase